LALYKYFIIIIIIIIISEHCSRVSPSVSGDFQIKVMGVIYILIARTSDMGAPAGDFRTCL